MSKHAIPQWVRDAFSTIENCAPSQNGMQTFTQMRTVIQSYFESQSSPSEPLDREAIRNEVLEECAQELDVIAHSTMNDRIEGIAHNFAGRIRSLKSQPAQPSDSRTEFSDTEMLEFLINGTYRFSEYREGWRLCKFRTIDTYDWDGTYYSTKRDAIKAAMRADREGK